jgi:hypothetical protein
MTSTLLRSSLPLLLVCSFALLAVVCSGAPASNPVASRLAQRLRTQSDQAPTTTQVEQADAAFQSVHAALSEAIVEQVNQTPNTTWTAGMNDYFEGKSYEFLKQSALKPVRVQHRGLRCHHGVLCCMFNALTSALVRLAGQHQFLVQEKLVRKVALFGVC